MLLAIDVGNTETKLGVFDDGAEALRQKWRVTTELRRTADEYGVFFTQLFTPAASTIAHVDAVAIASVVPKLDPVLEAVCDDSSASRRAFSKPERQTIMPVRHRAPGRGRRRSGRGGDRRARAFRRAADRDQLRHGDRLYARSPPTGEYLGVAIAPGITISIDALVGRTAKLPQIALEAPAAAIGRNTVDALQTGIVYGFVGQTEAIVARMRAELGTPPRSIATGGLADIVAKQTVVIDAVDPDASLEGLRLFHEASSPIRISAICTQVRIAPFQARPEA